MRTQFEKVGDGWLMNSEVIEQLTVRLTEALYERFRDVRIYFEEAPSQGYNRAMLTPTGVSGTNMVDYRRGIADAVQLIRGYKLNPLAESNSMAATMNAFLEEIARDIEANTESAKAYAECRAQVEQLQVGDGVARNQARKA